MADETTEVTPEVTTETPADNVQITIEQICAAIVKSLGEVEVSLEDLLADYTSKSIAINQNEETKALTFSLVDAPEPQEVSTETE